MVGCTSWLSLQGEAGSLPIPGQGTPRDTLSLVLVKGSHNFHCLRRSVHVHAKADDCRSLVQGLEHEHVCVRSSRQSTLSIELQRPTCSEASAGPEDKVKLHQERTVQTAVAGAHLTHQAWGLP